MTLIKQSMIDLRSDTVTKPSQEMRKAMYEAEVGDDVFKEDPTVNRLEGYVAELLGKEAALFVPSGLMGNQICLNVLTEPGDEVICDREAHIFNYESSSPARLSGIQLYPLDGELGILKADQVEPHIRTTAYHMPRTKVIEVENTHNRAGGTIWQLNNIIELNKIAKKHQLFYHLDGARIWNACAETKISPEEYATHFDTVSCCFSKGLGAPVGSAIAGSKEFIHEAYRVRKAWGGGMRQVGILAAAALYAVQNNRERLQEDHWRAKHLAERIKLNPNLEIKMEAVQTNIILFKPLTMTPKEGLIKCRDLGLILTPGTIDSLRAVTHLDINDENIENAANIIDEVFK